MEDVRHKQPGVKQRRTETVGKSKMRMSVIW